MLTKLKWLYSFKCLHVYFQNIIIVVWLQHRVYKKPQQSQGDSSVVICRVLKELEATQWNII